MSENFVVLDIETLGSSPHAGELLCTVVASEAGVEVYTGPKVGAQALALLSNPDVAVVSHSKYDPVWMRKAGLPITGPYHDTMVMAHLLNENQPLDLETLASHWCGITMDKRITRSDTKLWFTTDAGERVPLAEAPLDEVVAYCKRDVESTRTLYLTLRDELDNRDMLGDWEREHVPYTEVLIEMACAGIPLILDCKAQYTVGQWLTACCVKHLKVQLEVRGKKQRAQLEEDLGYSLNWNSNPALGKVLYSKVWEEPMRLPKAAEGEEYPPDFELGSEKRLYAYGTTMRKGLGLKVKARTEGGQPSTRKGDLLVHHGDEPFVKDLLAYRETEKVVGTYLDAYPRYTYKGRLYGNFSQTGTATGRLSHSNPNLGNQPAHGELGHAVRSLFRGQLLIGDHSQLEPRLMAHCSGDKVLLDIYREKRDIYLATANHIFGQEFTKEDSERQLAKTLVLALGYGAGAEKLAQILCLNGYWTATDKAAEYLKDLEALYSTFFEWKKHVHLEAKSRGFVRTIAGRYRRLEWAYGSAKWKVRNKADRQAVNAIIQGSAADILRRNMLDCQAFESNVRLLNQVHDELVFEVLNKPAFFEEQRQLAWAIQECCMQPGYKLDVPLKFDAAYCQSWADKGQGAIELPEGDYEPFSLEGSNG